MKKVLCVLAVVLLALSLCACNSKDYSNAVQLAESKKFVEAGEAFEALGDYKDSAEQAKAMFYSAAVAAMEDIDYQAAIPLFEKAGGYKDSDELVKEAYYEEGLWALDCTDYDTARSYFEKADDYSDSKEKLELLDTIILCAPYAGKWSTTVNIKDSINSAILVNHMTPIEEDVEIKMVLDLKEDGHYSFYGDVSNNMKRNISDIVFVADWGGLFDKISANQVKELKDNFYKYSVRDNNAEIPKFLSSEGSFLFMYQASLLVAPYLLSLTYENEGSYTINGNDFEFFDSEGKSVGKGTASGDSMAMSEMNVNTFSELFPATLTREA